MLDTETKRRIDTARDILVGKVPDPKSQVEQITIALIYKFMDDMDAQSEELGGARTFFAGEFEKYSWAKLMSVGMGGFEVLNLYAEAITRMTQNANLPLLFRDIFKNAYLPYRDPETLKQFLKTINEFSYDHSERLGDAFEYLLSVLGSQGDAGQFRTPRHIIDFMVALLDPQKNESILDPACGTAGFLISAYKYILNANARDGRPGAGLTPDQRARLMNNIKGYDISPDMVRLSLVNLYLHGFSDPHIIEYDALTSEDKWNEHADIIMANPPFMSPKGGIRPHKRFSVQSSRSEVLFVDYIAEHLAANGRAAVIVPEGIIFQSGNAYKALRKMLVENYLVGVISLPAGVFNPYAGVKTSILWLDKALAKKTDEIIFVKIENDGFDLGAQRRESKLNDLPDALETLRAYAKTLRVFSPNDGLENPKGLGANVTVVEKARIAENGEYGLSGERYKSLLNNFSEYKLAKLQEICFINANSVIPEEYFGDGQIVYIDISSVENQTGRVSFENVVRSTDAPSRARRLVKNGDVIISTVRPNLKAFAYLENLPEKVIASTGFAVLAPKENLDAKFLLHAIKSDFAVSQMINRMGKGSYPSINQDDVSEIQIPLPPLAVQQEIVAEIEGYQKIIDGARQVVESYQPRIEIEREWEGVKLDELCQVVRGSSPRPKSDKRFYGGNVPRLMVADITRDGMYVTPQIDTLTEEGAKYSRAMKKGNVVLVVSGNPGLPSILAVDAYIHDGFAGFRDLDEERISPEFLYYVLLAKKEAHGSQSVGAVFQNLSTDQLREFEIPLPDLATQSRIVARIEREQELVAANRELMGMFEEKIRERVARVWGE